MRIRGKYITVLIERAGEYVTVGLSTACALAVTATPVEAASQDAASKAYIGGRYVYNISIDKLYDGDIRNGDAVMWTMNLHNRTIQGKAIASQSTSAPAQGYATTSVTLQGMGVIEWADLESWDLSDAYVTIADIIDLANALSEADENIDFNV